MKILPINNQKNIQPKFKGFSNVIHDVCPFKDFRPSFSFMSMRLDNINGKDLDIWHSIQKKITPNKKLSDVITFACFNDFNERYFLLNDTVLKLEPGMENTALGKVFLKAYTLLASLTKRIELRTPVVYDKNFNETLFKTVDNLLPIFENRVDFTKNFVAEAIKPDLSPVNSAKVMNESIQEELENYFFS